MHVAICMKHERAHSAPDRDWLLAIQYGLKKRGYSSELITSIKQVISDPNRFDIGLLRTLDGDLPTDPGELASALLEQQGVPFLDGYINKALTRSKTATQHLFQKAGIQQPPWIHIEPQEYPSFEEMQVLIDDVAVYTKPDAGGRCEGVVRFETITEAFAQYEQDEPWILQSAIEPSTVWRTIVNFNGVVSAYRKLPSPETGLAAITAGGERLYADPSPELEELSIKMLQAVNGGMMGADIIEAENGELYALELNSNFGFDVERKDKKDWIVNAIVDSLENKLQLS